MSFNEARGTEVPTSKHATPVAAELQPATAAFASPQTRGDRQIFFQKLACVVNSQWGIAVVGLAYLLGVSALLKPVEILVGGVSRAGDKRTEQLMASVGRSSTLALLGGMRSMVANGCWLQANLAWEKRDAVTTAAMIDLAVAADERPLYFWLNGARILANDFPEWRMAGPVPSALRPIANEEAAQSALRFLEKALRWHGPDAAIYIEMANIHLRRRSDLSEAARFYRLAAEQPGAPYYAARIHGEMLQALGRSAEALAWLKQVLVTLPANDELARREVVMERIELLRRAVELAPLGFVPE